MRLMKIQPEKRLALFGPKNFLGASPALYVADLWIPVTVGSQLAPELENDALKRNDLALFRVIGRLKPGISIVASVLSLNWTQLRSNLNEITVFRRIWTKGGT
jgi:hypothetical protein